MADRRLPEPPERIGGYASASTPSRRPVAGAIDFRFPEAFPEASRDMVKDEEIAASAELNEVVRDYRIRNLRASRIRCAMRPALVFCREAIHLGWGTHRIDKYGPFNLGWRTLMRNCPQLVG